MPIRTLKHGTVSFTTGAGTKSYALSPGEGNFSIGMIQAGNKASIIVNNRGTFLERVDGPEEPVTGSITILSNESYTNAGAARLLNAILGTGYYSGETTDDPGGIVWSGLMTVTHVRAGATETFTLANVRLTGAFAEGEAGNTITVNYEAAGNGSGDALAIASA